MIRFGITGREDSTRMASRCLMWPANEESCHLLRWAKVNNGGMESGYKVLVMQDVEVRDSAA